MTDSRLFHILFRSASPLTALALATGCTAPVVSDTAIAHAKQRVAAEVGAKPKEGSLIIVDYSKPSSEKRMTVVDLKSGRARMNSLVAHGVNSGLLYATDFSDRVGSEKSSLGLFRVAEPYYGKHGRSLRLDGLDPGFNINARRRAIVVHAADYVSKETMRENRDEYGRLGRSAGCFSLSDKDMAKLDRKLKGGPAYIFAYAPTMTAELGYDIPGLPDPMAPQPMPAAPPMPETPRPMLASAPEPAAMPRPVTADYQMAAPAPAQPTPVPPAQVTAAAERGTRNWTPLLTLSNAQAAR